MTAIVVDASVAAKWFLTEADEQLAIEILAATVPIGPELLAVETVAAITRRYRTGGLSLEQAQTKSAKAIALFASASVVLLRDEELLPRAAAIALDMNHPLQDCLYVACAEQVSGDLVTVDPKLLARAKSRFPFVRRL